MEVERAGREAAVPMVKDDRVYRPLTGRSVGRFSQMMTDNSNNDNLSSLSGPAPQHRLAAAPLALRPPGEPASSVSRLIVL